MHKNWDWFKYQEEDTEKEADLKFYVVNIGGSFLIVLPFVLLGIICHYYK